MWHLSFWKFNVTLWYGEGWQGTEEQANTGLQLFTFVLIDIPWVSVFPFNSSLWCIPYSSVASPCQSPSIPSGFLTHTVSLSTFVPSLSAQKMLVTLQSCFVQEETLRTLPQALSTPDVSHGVFVVILIFLLWWPGKFLSKSYLYLPVFHMGNGTNQLFCPKILQT